MNKEIYISIINLIKKTGEMSFDGIVDSIDFPKEEIRMELREMVGEGLVRMKEDSVDHDWVYRLNRKGEEWTQKHVSTTS